MESRTASSFSGPGLNKPTWKQTAKLQTGPVTATRQIVGDAGGPQGPLDKLFIQSSNLWLSHSVNAAKKHQLHAPISLNSSKTAHLIHVHSLISASYSRHYFTVFCYSISNIYAFSPENANNSPLEYGEIPKSTANSVQISMHRQSHHSRPLQKSIKQSSHSFQP